MKDTCLVRGWNFRVVQDILNTSKKEVIQDILTNKGAVSKYIIRYNDEY